MKIHLDIESYSEVDLARVGMYRYAVHPSTRIELLSYAIDDGPVVLWDANEEETIGPRIYGVLTSKDIEFHAFNAPFERVMLREVMGIDIPITQWHCTMARAWALGFSGGLEQVGIELGIAHDQRKMTDGRKLVLKFCKPAPRTHKVDRYDWNNSPEEWARYRQYNMQDVVSDRQISALLDLRYPQDPRWDRNMWIMDQEINDKGLPIDTHLVDKAIHLATQEKHLLKMELQKLTGLDNPASNAQFLKWMQQNISNVANVQGYTLLKFADDPRVALKLQLGKTSNSKWAALKRSTGDDGFLRGTFQYAGAQRTKRWAGRIFQPHNLPRPELEDIAMAADQISLGDLDWIRTLYDGERQPMEVLSDTLRAAVTAPDNQFLVVADLSGIEGRVLPWLAGFDAKLKRIEAGADEYVANAASTFNVPYEQVTKAQRLIGKVQELSLGYQGWVNAFNSMAKNYGVEFTEDESKQFIPAWRQRNGPIVRFWGILEDVVRMAYDHPDVTQEGDKLSFRYTNGDMQVTLPSGRVMIYYEFHVDPDGSMTYMGQNSYTRKWERLQTYGGKWAENLTQAVARDVLVVGLLRAKAAGLDVRGHVHDEIICLSHEGYQEADLHSLIHSMTAGSSWTTGLPLAAAGYWSKRYRK